MQATKQVIRIRLTNQKVEKRRKDYSDKHTTELVLDQRTRLLLFNLNQKGKLPAVENQINAGKEASVYKAMDVAVKVFATSNMIFKNRQVYIDGDRRFERMSSSSSNSRNLVRLWAEKEYRNLCRIHQAQLINVPKPILQHENIVAMELIDNAARLVDVARYFTLSKLTKLYFSIVRAVRDLYVKCQLVHGDLSEYNILYQITTKKLFLIDVGQAVDAINDNAAELLRLDLRNLNSFFAKLNVPIASNLKLFQFVTTPIKGVDIEAENQNENDDKQIINQNQAQLSPEQGNTDKQFNMNKYEVDADKVSDALTPPGKFVREEIVLAVRSLKAESELIPYSQIRDDVGFVTIRAIDQGADDNKIGLQLLGVDGDVQQFQKQKTKISQPAAPKILHLHKKKVDKQNQDQYNIIETPETGSIEQIKQINNQESQNVDNTEVQNDNAQDNLNQDAQCQQNKVNPKIIQEANKPDSEASDESSSSSQSLDIDLHNLDRSKYDKETWKRITQELKEKRRALRQDEDRKSKAQKKREKTVAKKKRLGKK